MESYWWMRKAERRSWSYIMRRIHRELYWIKEAGSKVNQEVQQREPEQNLVSTEKICDPDSTDKTDQNTETKWVQESWGSGDGGWGPEPAMDFKIELCRCDGREERVRRGLEKEYMDELRGLRHSFNSFNSRVKNRIRLRREFDFKEIAQREILEGEESSARVHLNEIQNHIKQLHTECGRADSDEGLGSEGTMSPTSAVSSF